MTLGKTRPVQLNPVRDETREAERRQMRNAFMPDYTGYVPGVYAQQA